MDVLKVTAKAEEHDLPKGTKIVAITDNSGRTYISFEGKKKLEDMERLNNGRNVLKVPDKCTSFTAMSDGEEFNVGVDFIQSSEDATTHDLRLEALEARVAALEASAHQVTAMKEPHPPKHNTDKDEEHHSTKGYAARKK